MAINPLKLFALLGALLLGGALGMSNQARADFISASFSFDDFGLTIQIGDSYHYDEYGYPQCTPFRALGKARSLGLYRARVKYVTPSAVVIGGRLSGRRVVASFANDVYCPVQYVKYIYGPRRIYDPHLWDRRDVVVAPTYVPPRYAPPRYVTPRNVAREYAGPYRWRAADRNVRMVQPIDRLINRVTAPDYAFAQRRALRRGVTGGVARNRVRDQARSQRLRNRSTQSRTGKKKYALGVSSKIGKKLKHKNRAGRGQTGKRSLKKAGVVIGTGNRASAPNHRKRDELKKGRSAKRVTAANAKKPQALRKATGSDKSVASKKPGGAKATKAVKKAVKRKLSSAQSKAKKSKPNRKAKAAPKKRKIAKKASKYRIAKSAAKKRKAVKKAAKRSLVKKAKPRRSLKKRNALKKAATKRAGKSIKKAKKATRSKRRIRKNKRKS